MEGADAGNQSFIYGPFPPAGTGLQAFHLWQLHSPTHIVALRQNQHAFHSYMSGWPCGLSGSRSSREESQRPATR